MKKIEELVWLANIGATSWDSVAYGIIAMCDVRGYRKSLNMVFASYTLKEAVDRLTEIGCKIYDKLYSVED